MGKKEKLQLAGGRRLVGRRSHEPTDGKACMQRVRFVVWLQELGTTTWTKQMTFADDERASELGVTTGDV